MKEESSFPDADLLIRNVKVLWPGSQYDGQTLDLSLHKGVVEKIGEGIEAEADQKILEQEGLHLSPGWFDMQANFRDPGNEEKEDLISGSRAAMQGGYTSLLLMPSTDPPIDHKGMVEDIRARTKGLPLNVHPAGTLSMGRKGSGIAELFDMKRAGALAFTDDRQPVSDSGLLTNALWYARTIGAPILSFPDDPNISRFGVMNEGELSTRLGMKGVPAMSERIAIERDLQLLEYTGGKLHFSTISTIGGLEKIREAKKNGLDLSCDVSVHHLYFEEERLRGFSPLYKFMPPLRDAETIAALKEGLKDGTIDHISSLHEPQAEEDKRVEFEVAAHGAPSLETAFGAARKVLEKELDIEELLKLFSEGPRKLLGVPLPELKEGTELEATLFDPQKKWSCERETRRSKAYRSPYEGEELLGKALGTVQNGFFHSAT